MGIPYTPPPQPPVYQPPTQTQNQNQEQQTLAELLQQQTQNADAESRAESTTVNSASQKNIQVNNNSNRIEFESFKIPETTISVSAYADLDGDVGALATANFPVGGKSRKKIVAALDKRVETIELEYERTYLSACASIHEQGFIVAKDAEYAQRLAKCDSHIIARALPTPPAPPAPKFTDSSAELKELREQNQLMRKQIQLLLEQRDVNGGY